MTPKRWCLLTAALLLLASAAVVLLVVVVDPYEIYHRALFYSPPYNSGTQVYSNAGVARSFTYDSIIVGSSVTENCTPSVYDAALGGRFVKLCMNGGLSRDHARMMDAASAPMNPAQAYSHGSSLSARYSSSTPGYRINVSPSLSRQDTFPVE